MDSKLSPKGAWLGHINHLNIGGHWPYLHISWLKLEWSNFACR